MRVVKKPIEGEAWKLDSRVLSHEPKDPTVPGWVWDSIANGKLRWSKDYNDWAVWSLEGLMVAHDKETLDYYIREAGWDAKTNRVLGWVKDEFIDSEPTIVEAEGDD